MDLPRCQCVLTSPQGEQDWCVQSVRGHGAALCSGCLKGHPNRVARGFKVTLRIAGTRPPRRRKA